MSDKVPVYIKLNETVLRAADEEVLKRKHSQPGFDYNRSKFIEEALEYYLRIKKGIPYILKKK